MVLNACNGKLLYTVTDSNYVIMFVLAILAQNATLGEICRTWRNVPNLEKWVTI